MSTPKTIKIAAAASLKNGLDDVINAFHEDPENEGICVTVPWYGSSGYLARQIICEEDYSPIHPDIFISASSSSDVARNILIAKGFRSLTPLPANNL
jgi:ABC-type molybdate transport system substrate-binding protein